MTILTSLRRLPLRQRGIVAALLLALAVSALCTLTTRSVAQVPGVDLQQLQQQIQQQQAGQANSPAAPPPPSVVLQPAAAPPSPPSPPSRLEQIMSARAGATLRQFGYDQLGLGKSVTVIEAGGVQDDYILGVGDEILVSLRGQENSPTPLRLTVDRNGQVLLPRLNPISAAGRSFGSFRQDVEAAVRRAYVATNAFVSLARVRQISVLVSGEVNNAGPRTVSGLSSVIDAILLSGGVRKSGSLRNIRVQRGTRQYVIDLYSVLGDRGGSAAFRLADGDRITVPLLGPTVAVSGLVRQPAIYELPPGQKEMPVRALMALAGGEEVRGLYRLSVLRIEPDGRNNLVGLRDDTGSIRDSEILFVQFAADQTVNRVILSGGSGLAGTFPVAQATMLADLLKSPGFLGNDPYTLIGLISRRDPRTLMRTITAFTPLAVLRGTENLALQSDDIVHVFSVDESRLTREYLRQYRTRREAEADAIRNPLGASNAAQADTSTPGANALVNTLANNSVQAQNSAITDRRTAEQLAGRTATEARNAPADGQDAPAADPQGPSPSFQQQTLQGGDFAFDREAATFNQIAQQLQITPVVLSNFLLDHLATMNGAVRGPGTYLVGPNVTLQDLMTAAGGAGNWLDASSVELISTAVDPNSGRSLTQLNRLPLNGALMASYIVKPHDEFRFNEVFNDADIGNVTLQGEVRFVGTYKLTRGERLSDLLSRAGGLTGAAYPYGTIFLRNSARVQEQDAYVRAAKQAQDQLMMAMTRVGNDKLDPSVFTAMQGFVSELRNQKALGRIAVQADPSVLAARPALDPLLEPGDVIYIPPRPSTIAVYGDVMQPGSFPYQPGLTIGDYVERAGGYGRYADDSQTFVVLPDGTARKVERSWFRFDASTSLPPGSAIVVPKDLAPLDLRQTIIDVTQILSQLAVTTASIAVLSKQ
jgi:protein involved in polysaccharide export with SLBB domain